MDFPGGMLMRNDDLSLRLWKNVDKCREQIGLTLNDICLRTGIKIDKIKNWRTRLTIPQADELFLVAEALDVSMEYLLTGQTTKVQIYSARVKAVADELQKDQDKLGAVEVLLFGKNAGASVFTKNA